MSVIESTDIDDLVTGTLNRLNKPQFINIMPDLQAYEVMPNMIKRAKILSGGIGYKNRPAFDNGGNAQMTGLHNVDTYNIVDHLDEFRVPWRRSTTHWAYDVREIAENSGEELVTNIIKPRELGAMTSFAELMEDQVFGAPTGPSDKESIWGFEYHFPSSQSTGFHGTNPSGFSDKAGIDASSQSKWCSYTGAYTNVSKNDLVSLMRGAFRKTNWKSPTTVKDAVEGKFDNLKIYMDDERSDKFEELAEGQNENLGQNIAPSKVPGVGTDMNGSVMFKRIPICYLPVLDAKTDGSIYMVNLNTVFPIILKGDNMRRSKPIIIPNQHNNRAVHYDCSWNIVCENYRMNARFVLAA